MNTNLPDLLRKLVALAHREHFNCEMDTFYGCPLSVDGCSDDNQGPDCNCGADEHNAEVQEVVAAILSAPASTFERAAKICRYYLKHQNHPSRWEDKSEFEKGVQVACDNLAALMLQEAEK